ncbi:LysR family transcriptional regulator [Agarivorans gilvus]|uniref:LysR family transcriptional regulator n=1 Tax=Agarivorans gilvus TaxID=680279 RepID=A0ABQ1I561_9ALTE|nr:LysR family transcriptional regulator [Agarivorans gilvus]GGB15294.1 LysR family transcriptional regulator [Agarivorans gilvus]
MELRQLRQFVAVAQLGSFTAAAKQLGIAQPAISATIKKLEQQLSIQLLQRNERKVSLSAEGEVLYQHATQLLKQAEDTEQAMQSLKGLDSGTVTIGIPSMMGSYFFPPLLMAFKNQYPQLNLSVIDAGTELVRQKLLNGELDLGIVVTTDVPAELVCEPIYTGELLACCSQDNPLSQQNSISHREFLEHELVLFREGYFHHKVIEQISREQQMVPQVSFQTNLIPLIKSIVARDFGISTLLSMVLQPGDALHSLSFDPPFYLELGLAWRRDAYLSRANQRFREFVLANCQDRS